MSDTIPKMAEARISLFLGDSEYRLKPSELQEALSKIGLHIVTEAERKVLDASWAIPDGTLSLALREVGADNWVSLPSSIVAHLQAEKSRRTP